MTSDELLKQVLQGVLVLVGEYRASHAETRDTSIRRQAAKSNTFARHTWLNAIGMTASTACF